MHLCDTHHRLYKGIGHVINGMFQHQSVHIEHYDGQCRVGTDGLSVEYRLRQTHRFLFYRARSVQSSQHSCR